MIEQDKQITKEQDKQITKEQALEALDNLDDYTRMETGVIAYGPVECLRKFIEQQPVDKTS